MGQNSKILSCRPCRERKVRCDRLTPCKSCIRHNCIDQCHGYKPPTSVSNRLPLPRADRRPPATQVTATQAPEHLYAESRPAYTPSSRNDEECVAGQRRSGAPDLATDCSSQATWPEHCLQSVEALHVHRNLEQLRMGSRPVVLPPASSSFCAGSRLSATEKTDWQIYLLASLPPRAQCDLYVAWFLEHVNYIYQSMHAASFRQQYAALWATPVTKVDLIWLSLLYVMISMSTMLIEPEICTTLGFDATGLRESAHHWFRLSRQALHAGEYEAKPCLTQLLVFQESQLYWYATKAIESLNSALGQAIRCAQALGLDKDRTPSTNLESEMRHRLWWDLCSDDTFQSLCLDRQPLVQSHLSEVPFPENCDDCDLTPSSIFPRPVEEPTVMSKNVYRARIFKVLNGLYANNGSKISSYEAVSAIDDQITEIMNGYPWYFLRRSESSPIFASTTFPPAYDYLQWQHHIVHNSICVQRIRMYRPFLRTHFDSCWSKCVAAAEGAFAVYNSIRAVDADRFRRSQKKVVQSYQIFCSAISIAVFLLVERPVLPARILTDIELVIQDLKELSENQNAVPIAVDGRRTLAKILDAYQGYCRDANTTRANGSSSTENEDLHTLVPEISIVMGGKTSTKRYLDTCIAPRPTETGGTPATIGHDTSMNTPAGPMTDIPLRSPLESMSTAVFTNAQDPFGTDPTTGLNLGLHFDVFGWNFDDTAFLDGSLS